MQRSRLARSFSWLPRVLRHAGPFLAIAALVVLVPGWISAAPAARSAYVTNYADDTVSVIDIETGTVTGTLAVGDGPTDVVISPDGNRAFVTNRDSGTLSVIDTYQNTVAETFVTTGSPQAVTILPDGTTLYVANLAGSEVWAIDSGTGTTTAVIGVGVSPRDLHVTPNGSSVYVANRNSNDVSVIDTATNSVVETLPASPIPTAIRVTPDGSRVYVGPNGGVLVLDTSTGNLVDTLVWDGRTTRQIAFTPNGQRAWVSRYAGGSPVVHVIEVATGAVITDLSLGTQPTGIAFTPDGSRGYVTDTGLGVVYVVDTETYALLDTLTVGSTPGSIAITPATLDVAYVTNFNDGTVSVVDLETKVEMTTVDVGGSPNGVEISPDGRRAYVAVYGSNNLTVVDTCANTIANTVPLPGTTGGGVAVMPDGSRVYVSDSSSSSVWIVDTETWTVSGTVDVGTSPRGLDLTPDGSRLWVANRNSGSVSVVDTSIEAEVATLGAGSIPVSVRISPDGSRAIVGPNGSVLIFDTATETLLDTLAQDGRTTRDIAFTTDGARAYVARHSGGTPVVHVIDVATLAVIDNLSVGSQPNGIAAGTDGNHVYVADLASDALYVIDTATDLVTTTIPVGDQPGFVAIATVSRECLGGADLTVVQSDTDPVILPQNIAYTVVVTNNGPEDASASLSDELPVGAAFVSATPTRGTCDESAGNVTCDLGLLSPDDEVTVVIVVTPVGAGFYSNHAGVSSAVWDPEPDNNESTEETTADVVIDFDYEVTAGGTSTLRPSIPFGWFVDLWPGERWYLNGQHQGRLYCFGSGIFCIDYVPDTVHPLRTIDDWTVPGSSSRRGGALVDESIEGSRARFLSHSGGIVQPGEYCIRRWRGLCIERQGRYYSYRGSYRASANVQWNLERRSVRHIVSSRPSAPVSISADEGEKVLATWDFVPHDGEFLGYLSSRRSRIAHSNRHVRLKIIGPADQKQLVASTDYRQVTPWSDEEAGSATLSFSEGGKKLLTSTLAAPDGNTNWLTTDDNPGVATWMEGNELYASVIPGTLPPGSRAAMSGSGDAAISRVIAPADGHLPAGDAVAFPATVGAAPVDVEVVWSGVATAQGVVVNGIAATFGSGSWTASGVPLLPGENAIAATVLGEQGVLGEQAVLVTLDGDLDDDRIDNPIDEEPQASSSDFSDSASEGETLGTITDAGDQTVVIGDEPVPAGVYIASDSGGGAAPADITVCGGAATLLVGPAGEVGLVCADVLVDVVSGPIDLTLTADNSIEATATLDTGYSLGFEPDVISFSAGPFNPATVTVSIGGDTLPVPPGETVVYNQPPVADAGVDQVVELQQDGAEVTLDATASTDPDGDTLTFFWSGPFVEGEVDDEATPTVTLESLGVYMITLDVNDGRERSDSDTVQVEIVDSTPPALTLPEDWTVDCDSPGGADAGNVHIVEFLDSAGTEDMVDPEPSLVHDAPGFFALGPTAVEFTTADTTGNQSEGSAILTVQDETGPELLVTLDVDTLVPPDGSMVTVTAMLESTDSCSTPTVVLTSISANEDTLGDVEDAQFGTLDTSFRLRAERDALGPGRIYTVTYTATDAEANSTNGSAYVFVPPPMPAGDPIDLRIEQVAGGCRVTWNAVPGVTSYDVVRGHSIVLLDLGGVVDLGPVSCIESASTDTSTIGFEDPEVPQEGVPYFYLVEHDDGSGGSYGAGSNGKPRAAGPGGCGP